MSLYKRALNTLSLAPTYEEFAGIAQHCIWGSVWKDISMGCGLLAHSHFFYHHTFQIHVNVRVRYYASEVAPCNDVHNWMCLGKPPLYSCHKEKAISFLITYPEPSGW